jgi:hypothetical protein
MELTDATRMIMAESAAVPDLMRVTRYVHDELSTGRQVPPTTLRWVQREAGLEGVFNALKRKHGAEAVKDAVLVLEREINRRATAGGR